MRILLPGAIRFIAQRLPPVLLENGHQVNCCVWDKSRCYKSKYAGFDLEVVEVDFQNKESHTV